ncbi:sensor histidine kinase [Allostreptomyces psammosilenae]|uniref:histidine kinase n=1 Tax=Allostreptomyces psammosilenae TaxID=1892865 RepID=A0A852ZU00_9ACTN|nr:GAF domain-containing sensor histidine kinase [Allostreptomyces psammosilenae]NYI04760.1 signal transduction histidine kinase [Allostreptomyces psammosilenae]
MSTGQTAAPRRDLVGAKTLAGLSVAGLFAWSLPLMRRGPSAPALPEVLDQATGMTVGLALTTAGLLIIAHASGRTVGWLLMLSGVSMIVPQSATAVAATLPDGRGAPAVVLAGVVVGNTVHVTALNTLPLLLTDGRLPHRRWRWYVGAVAVWALVQAYVALARVPVFDGIDNPWSRGAAGRLGRELHAVLGAAIDLSAAPLIALALAVLALRWRRVRGSHRVRVKALLVPYLLWVAALMIDYHQRLTGWSQLAVLGGAALLWPIAVGYLFAKDQVRGVHHALSRLTTAFVLVVGVFALYAVGLGALSLLDPAFASPGAAGLAAVSLLLGAALRTTTAETARAVDRVYHGGRTGAYHVVRDLAERLSHAVPPHEAPTVLCETVVDDLELPGARVEVDTHNGLRELARHGTCSEPTRCFDLVYDGTVIGRLLVSCRNGQRTIEESDSELLHFLADQVAPAIASARLYEDLQASRERIVIAREEERRRLRRDIHDGLGPALSGLRLQLDTARAILPPDDPTAGLLGQASADLARVISEARAITDDLVPAALGDIGLSDAVRRLADRLGLCTPSVTVSLTPDPLPPMPAAVEVAAYRITAEALNNVVRHARATHAEVRLLALPDHLMVEVTDDGVGLPKTRAGGGVGLTSMAERAEEIGGRCYIAGTATGTRVHAVVPRRVVPRQYRPGAARRTPQEPAADT